MNNSIHFFYNFGVKNSKFKNYMHYHLTFNRNIYIYTYEQLKDTLKNINRAIISCGFIFFFLAYLYLIVLHWACITYTKTHLYTISALYEFHNQVIQGLSTQSLELQLFCLEMHFEAAQ